MAVRGYGGHAPVSVELGCACRRSCGLSGCAPVTDSFLSSCSLGCGWRSRPRSVSAPIVGISEQLGPISLRLCRKAPSGCVSRHRQCTRTSRWRNWSMHSTSSGRLARSQTEPSSGWRRSRFFAHAHRCRAAKRFSSPKAGIDASTNFSRYENLTYKPIDDACGINPTPLDNPFKIKPTDPVPCGPHVACGAAPHRKRTAMRRIRLGALVHHAVSASSAKRTSLALRWAVAAYVCFWPNADVGTHLSIRPLSEVERTCRVHVQLVCV